jgi:rhodanese-related sulfurtransferase
MTSANRPDSLVPFQPISVEEFVQLLADPPANLQLIDVREPRELEMAHLEGFENLPLSEYGDWSAQICDRFNPEAETVVMCHHGMRSAQMCQWLASQGFTNVKNLTGGIDAYAVLIDPSIPRY